MSEHLDHVIRAYKGKCCGAIHVSQIRNGVPVTNNQTKPKRPDNRFWHEPCAKEIYLHFATKGFSETSRQILRFLMPGFVYFVRERDFLEVTLGQQAHLPHPW